MPLSDSTLIIKIDSESKPNKDNTLLLDAWFPEVYWKLGTLYMDHNQWEKATIEIGRFLSLLQLEGNKPIFEQSMSYLTECAFELKDKKLTEYFAKKTLEINPNNTYVQKYLE